MNQRKKIISTLLVMVLVLTMFSGCSKKADANDPILGKWTATEMGGMKMEDIAELTGEEMPAVTMDFKDDGSGNAAFSGEEEAFTWEKDGDSYALDLGAEEKSVATIADNVLTITVEGQEMKFEKK